MIKSNNDKGTESNFREVGLELRVNDVPETIRNQGKISQERGGDHVMSRKERTLMPCMNKEQHV